MPDRNHVSWSAMISGYDQAGRPLKAIQLFSRMKVEEANEFVYASAVSACANVSFVSNSLDSMNMKYGWSSDALSVFITNSERHTVAYDAMVKGLVENKQVEKAYEMFKLMCQ
ncbi:hypothetical protein L1987_54517 [Smallanthus sonchifolius]|uniref:Uncharacterized protein n=1 Tax=Smallanthus sonchifolius TaxID=185202 RepID=A0ACB9E812_9ASTR|nr:hypothetical protein L1987_54517 [Smallanthus sonchifolius]